MIRSKMTLIAFAVAAALPSGAAAQSERTLEITWCRAGTVSLLAKEDKTVVWALDHRGVAQAKDPMDPKHGETQRCVGTIAVIDGKTSGGGWCKSQEAKGEDWYLVEWTASAKPGAGTWAFRYGSGKYKGVTGGGTYESLGPTRPIEPGTYQNCALVKGTQKLLK